jgi:D-alanyl-D-alanine carboxypeptidase (penicillin-binding protein 5/6)|tara:strand:+ start:2681 stop:3838 length:1158 start_codon:yes stop_codon:yes gene_type:complete
MNKKVLTSLLIFFNILSTNVNSSEFSINAKTAILQDYLSGKILYEKNPDLRIFPASMTKIMTSIIAFDLIKNNHLKLDEKFFVSENAWRLSQAGYSSMFIMVGDQITVENLLKGIIISSGNDACVALAEGIAGTEEEFAIMMTSKANEIGMTNTNFANSSGINHPENLSTVRDILIMSNYLIKNYPEHYEYFKEKEFTWDRTGGEPITQGNRNPLLYKNIGVDGIKTGFLSYEKYSLASSIERNNRRLIAVASGFNTRKTRSKESQKILTWGLTNFDTVQIAKKDSKFLELDVWLGRKETVEVYSKFDIYKTIKKARLKKLETKIIYNGPIEAPIKKNDKIAKLIINYDGDFLSEHDLFSSENIKKNNIIYRIINSINYLIWGDV